MRFTNLPPKAASYVAQGAASAAPVSPVPRPTDTLAPEPQSSAIPALLAHPAALDTPATGTDALLSVEQAAGLLGLDASLVRRYCRRGDLAAQRIGHGWVIYESHVRLFAALPRPTGRPPKRPATKTEPRATTNGPDILAPSDQPRPTDPSVSQSVSQEVSRP